MAGKRRKYSRLSARERRRYARQTVLFTFLTIILIAAIVIWGVPSLVKVAIFLGDLRSSSQPISGEDTIPPTPPVLQPLSEATSSPTMRLEGFAEEGATVIVSVNNAKKAEMVVESDGEFLFNSLRLEDGENRISAVAIDDAGNESRPSSTYRVTYDAFPPNLELLSPKDSSSFYGASEKIVQVTGITDTDATVKVNDKLVIVGQDGKFSHNLELSNGENEITVIARDRAGNEMVERIKATYEE